MTESLVKYFKKDPLLATDIGDFEYVSSLGQGGNAHVLLFRRKAHDFAIKFIPNEQGEKLRRFRDEFFGAAQIPTHKNVVRSYHFDTKIIDGIAYSLIVMKAYDKTLSKIYSETVEASNEEKGRKLWKIFSDLCNGLNHLHTHHIIHRDIKPQNIFFDEKADSFVIGDLGIAHFKIDEFSKEALTKPTDRLANYLFSAPEQADSKHVITAAADIYALGQVIQWFLTGSTIRGLGRSSFAGNSAQDTLSILDAFTNKALRDKAAERFQSIKEIIEFVNAAKQPLRPDPWVKIHSFDNVIRQSFPQIQKTLSTSNAVEIEKYIENFTRECSPEDFWYMWANEGDGHFKSLGKLDGKSWLFNDMTEMTIRNLVIYKDDGYLYKNFFIILVGPDKPFTYSTFDGKKVRRKSTVGWTEDMAVLVDDRFYVDPNEIKNGFYRMGDETIAVGPERFKERHRYLVPFGFIVVPTETATASMNDRKPTGELIRAVIKEKNLNNQDLVKYLDATRSHHSRELTKWN